VFLWRSLRPDALTILLGVLARRYDSGALRTRAAAPDGEGRRGSTPSEKAGDRGPPTTAPPR
jgi:hypothetical protein